MIPESKLNVFQIQIPFPSSVLPSSISLFLNSTSLIPKANPKEKIPSLERSQINPSIPTITNRTPLRDVKSSSLLQIVNKPSIDSLIEARLDNSSRRLDHSIIMKPDALKIRRIIGTKQDQVDVHPKHTVGSFARLQGKQKIEGQTINAQITSENTKKDLTCEEKNYRDQNKYKRDKPQQSSSFLCQGDKQIQFPKESDSQNQILPRIQYDSLSPSPRNIRSEKKILYQVIHQKQLSQGNQPKNLTQDTLIEDNYHNSKVNIQSIPPSYPSIPTIQSKYQLLSLNSPPWKPPSSNPTPVKPRFDQFENTTNFFAQIKNSCLNEFRLFNSDRGTPLRLSRPRKESYNGQMPRKDKKVTRSISNSALNSINVDSFSQPTCKTRLIQFSMKIAGEKQQIQTRKSNEKTSAVPQKQQQQGKNSEIQVQNFVKERQIDPSHILTSTNEKLGSWRLRSNSFQSPKDSILSQVLGGARAISHKRKDQKLPETTSCSTQTQVSQPQNKTNQQGQSSHVYIDDFDICQYVQEMTPHHA